MVLMDTESTAVLFTQSQFGVGNRGVCKPAPRPTDDDILRQEELDIEKMIQASANGNAADPSQLIKSANPELSKALSEEPSSCVIKEGKIDITAYCPIIRMYIVCVLYVLYL